MISHARAGDIQAPVALVVGASRGLGLLVARDLVRRGFAVVITARDVEELESARTLLVRDFPEGSITPRVCDAGDAAATAALVQEVEERLGPISVAVCVAGVIQVGPAEVMIDGDFRQAVDIMLWGPVNLAQSVLPGMRARREGRIGIVSSIGGGVAAPHLLPYCTAKFGATGFGQGLAAELNGTGVTATVVMPGLMRTGSHERAQFAGDQPREYAWFATAASLPLLSMDAERAARRIVSGVLAGRPIVVLTPLAKVGLRVHGLMPATTVRVMGVVSRLLPGPGNRPGPHLVEGWQAQHRVDSSVLEHVTVLGRRAAERFNERVGRGLGPTSRGGRRRRTRSLPQR